MTELLLYNPNTSGETPDVSMVYSLDLCFCDTYGLLRATHSHNPPRHAHIVSRARHFYAYVGAGPKPFHPHMSKLMCVLGLLTLVSHLFVICIDDIVIRIGSAICCSSAHIRAGASCSLRLLIHLSK